jgi:hypothetical protein
MCIPEQNYSEGRGNTITLSGYFEGNVLVTLPVKG